jgi:hypothetical protein
VSKNKGRSTRSQDATGDKQKRQSTRPQGTIRPLITELVPIIRLVEYGSSRIGKPLAEEHVRGSWLDGSLPVWQRSWPELHGSALPESRWLQASPQTITELEGRGFSFEQIVEDCPIGSYPDNKSCSSFHVHRDELPRMFPFGGETAEPVRHPGGRPRIYDHEQILIEAATYIALNGLPEQAADLYGTIGSILGDRAPDDTQLRTILSPLVKRIEEALGRNKRAETSFR